MSVLRAAVADYVGLRRRLGFTLKDAEGLLGAFVDYLDERGAWHITTEHALAWATGPQGVQPAWWRQRLAAVRGFATYMATIDPHTEVPPAGLLPTSGARVSPYLYSSSDVTALMAATAGLSPALRAATYHTLIGLLAVSGLRIGEAIRLDQADVDDGAAVLTVRRSKRDSYRKVPLHATTIDVLARYARLRRGRFPDPPAPALLVSIRGTRLSYSAVNATFHELLHRAGLPERGSACRPRIHDLRHSFAVNTVLGWYQDGADVDARLPLLSAMLGHASPASTYWYLQASPQLLAIVAERMENVLGAMP